MAIGYYRHLIWIRVCGSHVSVLQDSLERALGKMLEVEHPEFVSAATPATWLMWPVVAC